MRSDPKTKTKKAPATADSSLEVLADWLQENADPWGTLIALRLARKHAEASEFLFAHEAALCGSFNAHDFDWRDGVIVGAELEGAQLERPVRELLSLPSAARLERLSLSGNVTAVLPLLSREAPATLEVLNLDAPRARGVSELNLPRLRRLTVKLRGSALESVLDARLPSLRGLRLDVCDGTAPPVAFFERLMASALLAQLEELDFASRAVLDGNGLRCLLSHADGLAHLERLSVPFEDWTIGKPQRALASKRFTARRARAREAASREEERYQKGLDVLTELWRKT